jgi:phospholipid/cholesterol/gamma-HCH transport system substrate-binding protein/paraquat-inducible protein B
MTSERKYFKIGIFVLGAVAFLTVAVAALGAGSMFAKTYRLETYLDETIEGLDVGSPVKYRGIKVGVVEAIDLVATTYNNKDGRIRLILAFHQPPGRMLVKGSTSERVQSLSDMGMRVHLASSGLMGDVYLEIELMDPKENPPPAITWKPTLPYLPSVQSTETQVTGQVLSILHNLQGMRFDQISDKIVALLESLDHVAADRLPATFEKLDGTLDRISATLRRVDRTLAEESGSMDQTMDNLRVATGDLRELMGQLRQYPKQALFGEAPPKRAVTK